MILHLGVIDIPYVAPNPQPKKIGKPRRGVRRRPRKGSAQKYGNITTGDVAEILESKYHVMEIFFRENEGAIAGDVENSLKGSVESLLSGGPAEFNAWGSATSKIEDRFKQFLSNREMDRLGYPGVPTAAAQRGVSHRMKRPYKRRAPRPSFIDTGLYQSSMTAWVD